MKRLLVTGSRDWDDIVTLRDAINKAVNHLGNRVILVHGACPTGADKLADDWFMYAYRRPCSIEAHPADWDIYGKRAGYVRNAEMVNAGADLCLAFIKNESRGASMTAKMAEDAGIETWRYIE